MNLPRCLYLKRAFDFSLSVTGLFISLPLWCVFALAIRLSDGGPVFYFQERVGKGGRIFKGIKFRSMIPDAEKMSVLSRQKRMIPGLPKSAEYSGPQRWMSCPNW